MATTQEVNDFMKKNMKFVPRMYQILNGVIPDNGMAFAQFYQTVFGDGAIPKRLKELMFVAVGIAYMSPRCLIHVVPAIEAGATDAEILETCVVGTVAAGFVPGGPGIPYAFEYALKTLDVAGKHRKGEKWEYLPASQFDHGTY
ncbi:MAG: carboxymuconolactone decarboxylase family protein [Chloroflexi bacterium]|nr:carboxymuconolactone decarboxylase family protein [Chloroflexota bacterium]MBI3761335.1 carboxymuconolactone decarboxylase family protein [Chloroflexota bacterium]